MSMTIFRQRLTEAIVASGKSPNQVAKEAGVSHFCIYSWMRENDRMPNAFNLACIADALGVSMDWLWGRDEKWRSTQK